MSFYFIGQCLTRHFVVLVPWSWRSPRQRVSRRCASWLGCVGLVGLPWCFRRVLCFFGAGYVGPSWGLCYQVWQGILLNTAPSELILCHGVPMGRLEAARPGAARTFATAERCVFRRRRSCLWHSEIGQLSSEVSSLPLADGHLKLLSPPLDLGVILGHCECSVLYRCCWRCCCHRMSPTWCQQELYKPKLYVKVGRASLGVLIYCQRLINHQASSQ